MTATPSPNGGEFGGFDERGGGERVALAEMTFIENPVFQRWLLGYKEACEALGYTSAVNSSGSDLNEQVAHIRSATDERVEMVVGHTSRVADASRFARACQTREVPTVTWWQIERWCHPADVGQYHVQHVLPNAVREGEIMASALFEDMDASGSFVHIEGLPDSISNRARNVGIERALRRYPDIDQLDGGLSGNWTKESGRDNMERFLSDHGADIDAVLCQNDSMALGAAKVLERHGIDVPINGCDAIPKGVEAVRDGRLNFTVTNPIAWQGGWAVVRCHDWHNGWRPKTPERIMMHTGQQVVSQSRGNYSNLTDRTLEADAYAQKLRSQCGTPYDWTLMSETEGENWDPQNKLVPVTKREMRDVLRWTEESRPSGYSLPEGYSDAEVAAVRQKYGNSYERDPLEE